MFEITFFLELLSDQTWFHVKSDWLEESRPSYMLFRIFLPYFRITLYAHKWTKLQDQEDDID